MDRLKRYREMRDSSTTPEPFSGGGRRGLFVVQKHAATRMHYDFRLEWRGVLLSWAVPRGPSYDRSVKRLAVRTEDHPVDYADFEGVIPAGNYGAGRVIVWDQGRWQPVGDVDEGLEAGKLLFELHGHKLHGLWALVKTKGKARGVSPGQEAWLLLKERDGYAPQAPPDTSIFSGLSVQEGLPDALKSIFESYPDTLSPKNKNNKSIKPIKPMLLTTQEVAPEGEDWLYEIKYDGYRLLAQKNGPDVVGHYRSGLDCTRLYPELMRALSHWPASSLGLDGEVVSLNKAGQPSFSRLQQRAQQMSAKGLRLAQATVDLPVVYFVFDLLSLNGHDLSRLPLHERKALLSALCPDAGPIRFVEHIEGSKDAEIGMAFFESVAGLGLEGVVAKRADSAYQAARSEHWVKVKHEQAALFVVVGYLEDETGKGLSSLHVASAESGLVYAGRVASGMSKRTREALYERFQSLRLGAESVSLESRSSSEVNRAVVPKIWVEVRYKERTESGNLRHPRFLRWAKEVAPFEVDSELAEVVGEVPESSIERAPESVQVARPEKIFYPDAGYTKGELFEYYRSAASAMQPYLRERPLVVTRFPEGIEGKSFYQKDAPKWIPDWIQRCRLYSEHSEREIEYFVCNHAEALLYLINLGAIPIHLWSSRQGRIGYPDWCILDLDPKGAPFDNVIALAKEIKGVCDEIGLRCYLKTSGSSGLHVLVPLSGTMTYEHSRRLAELLCRVVLDRQPGIATMNRSLNRRDGKVYLDWLQNRQGQLLVSPYSARPNAFGGVSMPLSWRALTKKTRIEDFTIRTAPRLLKRRKTDPFLGVLTPSDNILDALERLSEILSTK